MSDDLIKRLRKRAKDDRQIQANNEVVASALRGQRLLFDQGVHSEANTFAVRLALEYERCAKNDADLAKDWDEAANRIEQLERERDGYLAERNKFKLYLQRTHADFELEAAAVEALTAKLAKVVEMLEWACNTLKEINPRNCDHGDVCYLNDASVEVTLGIRTTLAELEGK